MMQVAFRYPAPEGTKFAPDCFDRQIGKPVRFVDEYRISRQGRLVRALVDKDGTAVTLTLDVPDLVKGMTAPHPAKGDPDVRP